MVNQRFHGNEADSAGDAAEQPQQKPDCETWRQRKESGAERVHKDAERDAPTTDLLHQERRPESGGGGAQKINAGVKADDFGATASVAHPESGERRAEAEAESPAKAGEADSGQSARRGAGRAGHTSYLQCIERSEPAAEANGFRHLVL